MDQQDAVLYVYLFYNFRVHSTCFEKSCLSSSGIYRNVLCNTIHYNKFLMMKDKIFEKHVEWT